MARSHERPLKQDSLYHFCRVVFSLNTSPFLLNATLRHHISKFKEEDPKFVRRMIESFYVDDLVTGKDNTAKAFTLYEKSKNRPASGGFKLHKWTTNDKALKDLIEQEENRKLENASVTTEEESFVKFTLGSDVSKKLS